MNKKLKLYLVERDTDDEEYDIYDAIVVCAENKDEARKIHPYCDVILKNNKWRYLENNKECQYAEGCWVSAKDIDKLKVTKIGEADKHIKKGVVFASFKAG